MKPAIQAFLEQNERVVHADEIVEALSQQGVTLSSKDPKATVVTAVLRMKNDGLVVTLGQNRYICAKHYTEDAQLDADALDTLRRTADGNGSVEVATTVTLSP